jgi:membrane associated rhomboid family serine protease
VIPISDSPVRRTRPWVTYAIIVVNVVVFVYLLTLSTAAPTAPREFTRAMRDQADEVCYGLEVVPSEADRFLCKWAFQPREFFDNLGGNSDVSRPDRPEILLSIVTALFIHGGWLHILGNMLFLWVFGDNIEDRLGHLPFLLFYLVAGIVASIVQGLVAPSSLTPVLGASGAVAGVLGAYLLFFPRATVRVVIPFFILILVPIPVPAALMIGLWFFQNLFSGFASVSQAVTPDQGTAWFAHIGGFAFGLLVALAASVRGRRA